MNAKLSVITFSNYSTCYGYETVYIKRNAGRNCGFCGLYAIPASELNIQEDIFTIDGRLIANRIK